MTGTIDVARIFPDGYVRPGTQWLLIRGLSSLTGGGGSCWGLGLDWGPGPLKELSWQLAAGELVCILKKKSTVTPHRRRVHWHPLHPAGYVPGRH